MTQKKLHIVAAVALLLALAHLLFPAVKVDSATVILILVPVLIWLSPLIESFEGLGVKIQLRDVKKPVDAVIEAPTKAAVVAGASRTSAMPAPDQKSESVVASLRTVAGTDPNLALVGFGIEIERRIRELARRKGYEAPWSVATLLRELRKKNVLPDTVTAALEDLIGLRNQAAHGRTVEPAAAAWVLDHGPEILATLDRLLESDNRSSPPES